MTLGHLVQRASKLAINNSPAILTTIGIVGTVTTAYLAGKASFEAADMIRLKEADDELRDEAYLQDPRELLKARVDLVWRLYIPAVATGTATIACIIGANQVGARRAAGLAAAYSITEKGFDEYKAKVVEKFGPKKEEQVADEVLADRISQADLDGVTLFGLDKGQLCYDKFSDRYFRSTVEDIYGAMNRLNHALNHDGYASLSEFYDMLGLPSMSYAHDVGWSADQLLDVRISTHLAPGDVPCIAMEFRNDPKPDYGRFR